MITILLVIVGASLITALCALGISVSHAPVGFEDENGFHFGTERKTNRKPRQRSKHRVHAMVGAGDLHQPAA